IEMVDGATLDIPGLSGRVANIVTSRDAAEGVSGQFEWNPQIETDYASRRIFAGRAAVTGTSGPVGYTIAAENNPFYGGTGGPNVLTYGDGAREERFNHTNSVQHNPRLSTQLRIDGPGSSAGNLSLSYQWSWNRARARTSSSLPRPASRRWRKRSAPAATATTTRSAAISSSRSVPVGSN